LILGIDKRRSIGKIILIEKNKCFSFLIGFDKIHYLLKLVKINIISKIIYVFLV